jgi:predicted alpha/beta hydrolase
MTRVGAQSRVKRQRMRCFLFLKTVVPIYKVTRRQILQDNNGINKQISVNHIRQWVETF